MFGLYHCTRIMKVNRPTIPFLEISRYDASVVGENIVSVQECKHMSLLTTLVGVLAVKVLYYFSSNASKKDIIWT